MATGNVQITGNTSGGPDGARTFGPFTTNASSSVDQTLIVTLAVGANTVTVPTGVTCAIIVPPNAANPTPNPAYGGVLTLKGNTADTGVAISAFGATELNWAGTVLGAPSPPASFIINATATGTLTVWFM